MLLVEGEHMSGAAQNQHTLLIRPIMWQIIHHLTLHCYIHIIFSRDLNIKNIHEVALLM
jgi:hypothetical protein